ncbi:MAG: DUF5695 domain-containing protein [Planctomycetota bacterium]|jgi:hypothetical protein
MNRSFQYLFDVKRIKIGSWAQMRRRAKLSEILVLTVSGFCALAQGNSLSSSDRSYFTVGFGPAGITSLKRPGDLTDLNYIMQGEALGNIVVRYRAGGREWRQAITAQMADRRTTGPTVAGQAYSVSYKIGGRGQNELELTEHFTLDGDELVWRMDFRNRADTPLEIGDIALPRVFNTREATYAKRLNTHRFISGHGSFTYWVRANGVGPCLVMTPLAGTKLEYFDSESVAYIRSAVRGAGEKRGTWRQEHTSIVLDQQGKRGDTVSYGFRFHWAQDYHAVRDVLHDHGAFDINVVPGMVVPSDLHAMFSLRTKNAIGQDSVVAEYPGRTKIEYLGLKGRDIHVYKVRFECLGENLLSVNYGTGRYMVLEFFVTEPLETVIKKRAAFIAGNQQHRDPSKWYNGLFSLWDMQEEVLRGPDNLGGLSPYMVGGSDDPSTGKPVYLAEKNTAYPNPREIEALEYFIENFVWGKHQRTDKEHPKPYGIYGSVNWHLNRNYKWGVESEDKAKNLEKRFGDPEGTGLGRERMWRTFDYTHYIMLYYNMYRLAKSYPDLVDYLDAGGYLDRAFGTAMAFFEVPYSIYMPGPNLWSFKGYSDWAYKQGNFHEKYLVDLIEALEAEGRQAEAIWLRREWEKKVKYFIYDDPYPYMSEFSFDRTAYESTHAIARYAIENPLRPDKNLWYDKNLKKWYSHPVVKRDDAVNFMDKQIATNIALRGWLETSYSFLGSARSGGRSHLCYMSQMAGWSILDYALHYSDEPVKYLRLGYASILSSWALVNCGTPESNYGYWYPGKGNDGAAGWAFKPEKYGKTWIRKDLGRGPWFYDGEIDHGLSGGVNAACTVVIDDPIFGLLAYGGNLTTEGNRVSVVCRDGVRQRLHFIKGNIRFHMSLSSDGFAGGASVEFFDNLNTVKFTLENRSANRHETELTVLGLPSGSYTFSADGGKIKTLQADVKNEVTVKLPVPAGNKTTEILIELTKRD